MRNNSGYKIAIAVLTCLVIIEGILLVRSRVSRPPKVIKAPEAVKGRIAIVIDDWGYNSNNLAALERIKYPVTLSILPNLPYSAGVAAEAQRLGFEVILHLPLEPRERFSLEKNTVLASMDEARILSIMERDIASVPNIKGVSNHMGSKAVSDARTMRIILSELKRRGLYFLDSLVSPDSLGSALSRKMQIGFAKRDIFLDNNEDPEYIKSQLYKLESRARKAGRAIGIGHDREVTLRVLEEVMPLLARKGYKFVSVSELVTK